MPIQKDFDLHDVKVSQDELTRQSAIQDRLASDYITNTKVVDRNRAIHFKSTQLQQAKQLVTRLEKELRILEQEHTQLYEQELAKQPRAMSIDSLTGKVREIGNRDAIPKPIKKQVRIGRTYNSVTRQFEDIMDIEKPKVKKKSLNLLSGKWV